jgi:hypothetical protein
VSNRRRQTPPISYMVRSGEEESKRIRNGEDINTLLMDEILNLLFILSEKTSAFKSRSESSSYEVCLKCGYLFIMLMTFIALSYTDTKQTTASKTLDNLS